MDRLGKAEVVNAAEAQRHVRKPVAHPPTLTPRREWAGEDDNPMIYYGLIASANQLMREAVVQNKLAEEKTVLCFEMEAVSFGCNNACCCRCRLFSQRI